MKILVIGGTKFFGVHMINKLVKEGHDVTIATRGLHEDPFGDYVKRIVFDRSDEESCAKAFSDLYFDVVIDKIAYCSNDIVRIAGAINCKRYVCMSTTAVYQPLTIGTCEDDYCALDDYENIKWCERADLDYAEGKRNVERAIFLAEIGGSTENILFRCPFVVGPDDYTRRLHFYIEHVVGGIPMAIDNLDCQISMISSLEAGQFMAYLATADIFEPEQESDGEKIVDVIAVNGANKGTISLGEIIRYVEEKTGKKAILSEDGDAAPYNGTMENEVDTGLARELGYEFSPLRDWIFDLVDVLMGE